MNARLAALAGALLLVCARAEASPRSTAAPTAATTFDAPWSASPLAPVTSDVSVEKPPAAPRIRQTSLPNVFLLGAVRFYQVGISPADGGSCLLYPTCSGYSQLALRKHGPIVGFVMTAERVMRNHTGDYYPTIWKFGHWRNYDPVEMNDFWFPGVKKKTLAARAARAKALEGHP